jgi:hypothetical protein
MLDSVDIKKEYIPFTDSSAELFFITALGEATFYRRASGYFSSAVFSLFTLEFLDFAKRGGIIEIVCSNVMASEDVEILHDTEVFSEQGILET